MQNKFSILQPNSFYHIYNRANGNEKIFLNKDNYLFFLKKYKEYILPIANTYCYCLMPNHFHFLIQIKPEKELLSDKTFPKFNTLEKLDLNLEKKLSKQFSNFFSSYTQAFNKQQKRKGSVFIKNFKRKQIENKAYLYKIVHYIHYNPVEAGLVKTPEEWEFSSYNAFFSKTATLLEREETIEWFDDLENFQFVHKQKPKELDIIFD